METKVLVFSVYSFNRLDLDALPDEQKYGIAKEQVDGGYDDCAVFDNLDDFQKMLNNCDDSANIIGNSWVYFVNI